MPDDKQVSHIKNKGNLKSLTITKKTKRTFDCDYSSYESDGFIVNRLEGDEI